jgi:hypothetical protein
MCYEAITYGRDTATGLGRRPRPLGMHLARPPIRPPARADALDAPAYFAPRCSANTPLDGIADMAGARATKYMPLSTRAKTSGKKLVSVWFSPRLYL